MTKICIILLAHLVFYSKSLTYRYVSDDILANERPKHPNKIIHWLGVFEGRARTGKPQQDHFITIILHAIASTLIYTAFGMNDISFIAALLFSFNASNNQGAVWIAGRSYVWPVIGILGALTFIPLSPFFLTLAAYYNAGFLSPVILLGSEHPWLIAWMPLVWFIHIKRFKSNVGAKMKSELFVEDKQIKFVKIILVIKTLGFYFVHSIIPIKTTFYHSFLQSAAGCMKDKAYTWKDRFFWIGLLFLLSVSILWYVTGLTQIVFGLVWFIVTIAPFLNFFRIQQEIAERYMYLPNVGLMLALAGLIHQSPVISSAFITMHATKMWFYMDAYADDYMLIEQACLNSPSSWFAWHVRGMKRWDAQSHYEAMVLWTMARLISPKEFKVNFNIAAALKLFKRNEESEKYLKQAEENIPLGQEGQCKEIIDNFRNNKITILL